MLMVKSGAILCQYFAVVQAHEQVPVELFALLGLGSLWSSPGAIQMVSLIF